MIFAATRGWFETLERDILYTVTCLWHTPWWNRTFRAVQKDELAIPLILLALLFISLHEPRRAFRCFATILVALAACWIVATLCWVLVDRERPPHHYERLLRTEAEKAGCADHPEWLVMHKSPSTRPSFPSRHALTVGVVVTALWLTSRAVGLIAILYGLLVAVGRVYVGKHWPSDVLAGLVIGVVLAWAAWRLVPRILARMGRGAWVQGPDGSPTSADPATGGGARETGDADDSR